MEQIQENIILVAKCVDTRIENIGNCIYLTTPWTMNAETAHNYVSGILSLHETKSQVSYVAGRIIEVISLGPLSLEPSAPNKVAFIFERLQGLKVDPAKIKATYPETISEKREQIRY